MSNFYRDTDPIRGWYPTRVVDVDLYEINICYFHEDTEAQHLIRGITLPHSREIDFHIERLQIS